ncbi:C-type lectin domain family 17, member A-like [Argopecten irradians]|uniref:C-type lectin domain family 17, member A-like n=1 Tax=Argopecten irradians TaxID=31199 RepID=UPI003711EB7E
MKSGDYTCHRLDLCPFHDWMPFNGKCYYFDSAKSSADENVELCEGMDAKPIRVDTEEVNSFLRSEVSRRGSVSDVWIGANDKDVEGEWVWGPGDPASFTAWFDTEPDGASYENCAVIGMRGWHDVRCMRSATMACETSYNIPTLLTYTTLEP